jgi:hypothetical protein
MALGNIVKSSTFGELTDQATTQAYRDYADKCTTERRNFAMDRREFFSGRCKSLPINGNAIR